MITAAVLREYMNQSKGLQLHMADGRVKGSGAHKEKEK